eukprot:TRINITY_DN1420_c0_g1_i5.p1 TRINITY_DN1420_c0_g1~~TRINITY_DN1420_c0_g1_i5.p1  ORF type:complete len:730 (-),score=140.19 TRINITY_DN1420_c0_g1_i5:53-2242(-)
MQDGKDAPGIAGPNGRSSQSQASTPHSNPIPPRADTRHNNSQNRPAPDLVPERAKTYPRRSDIQEQERCGTSQHRGSRRSDAQDDTGTQQGKDLANNLQPSSPRNEIFVTITVLGARCDKDPLAVCQLTVNIQAWAPGPNAPRSLGIVDWSPGCEKRLRLKPAETELVFEVLKFEASGETRAPEGTIHGKVSVGDTGLTDDESANRLVALKGDPHVDGWRLDMRIRREGPKRSVGREGLTFRRAECRFTVPETVSFCGVATNDVYVSTQQCEVEPIRGRDRSALHLILKQAKDLIAHVHQEPRFAAPSSAAGAMPGILASLGMELSVCFQSLSEASHIDIIDGVPAMLVILAKFVEVLDTLVPIEDLGLDPAISRAAGGGEATPTFTEDVMQALRQVLGMNGFLPQCLACLGDANVWGWLLHAAGARGFAEELRFHLILVLRLTLAWDPPRGVSRPAEVILDSGGLEVLCDVVKDLGGKQQAESCETDVPPKAAQLGLAFDSLRLLLRLSLRSGDCSLRSPCRSKKGISSLISRGSRVSAAVAVHKLACDAVQALANLATVQTPELEEAVDAAVPATVRFLAFLMEVPPVAEKIDKDRLARAIVQSINARPLTLRLTLAVRELVVAPQQHRRVSWMAWSTAPDKRAKAIRDELNESLHRESMPNRLATKAKDQFSDVLEQKGRKQEMPDPTACLQDQARMRSEEIVAVAAFFDNVEAITEAIRGTKQAA